MEKETDTASKNGRIIKVTPATTRRGSSRVSAPIDGRTDVSSPAIGGIRKYMALVCKTTLMVAGTKVSINWTSDRATVST